MPYWEGIPQGQLSEDARLIQEACQSLQMSRCQDNSTIDSGILSARAETLVESLSYTTILKLSLITWYFDASAAPSEGLTRFLNQPSHNAIWRTIQDQYQRLTQQAVPFGEFTATLDFLLCPALGIASRGV